MDYLTAFIYIGIFLIFMVFVFSIGLLRPYMPKKEMLLVFLAAFLIGSLGGAFFLTPVYNELPDFASDVIPAISSSDNVYTADIAYSEGAPDIINSLKELNYVRSVDIMGFTITLSKLKNDDVKRIDHALGIIDNSYDSWNVSNSGKIDVKLKENSSVSSSLRSFSNWYELVYGYKIGSALIHIQIHSDPSHDKELTDFLISKNVVPTMIHGDTYNIVKNIEDHMLSENQFIVLCGIFGIIVSLFGVYYDKIAINLKKFFRWVNKKVKR